jgi:hypothetical protein
MDQPIPTITGSNAMQLISEAITAGTLEVLKERHVTNPMAKMAPPKGHPDRKPEDVTERLDKQAAKLIRRAKAAASHD